ncbi:MAG TPA: histidine kinase [Acidimicrobiales bacterium]|nr:histidine kinase [Acidimicrobiales bacterium]
MTTPTGRRRDGARNPARRRDPVARLRSSLLLKILAALVVALVGSSALTGFLEGRLTRSALHEQARRVAVSNLRVLAQAYAERERTLVGALRNLSQSLTANRLIDPDHHNELVGELGGVYRNLELDVVEVEQPNGRPLAEEAHVGDVLQGPPAITPDDRRTPVSRLLAAADGHWIQAVTVPIGTGADAPVLVGGYKFGDGFAYRLRRQLGDVGHVMLVANGKVVGSTFVDPLTSPPTVGAPGGPLPTEPVVVPFRGVETLVVYRTVSGSGGGVVGALGVSLADPEAPLDRSLERTRLVAAALLAAIALVVGWLCFRVLVRPLERLTSTARRIAGGDLEASFATTGSDEVAVLAQTLEQMRLELRDQLDLIARQAAVLQDSSQRIVAAQDEERHRLARDLHDGIQQHLVVLRMGFGLATEAAERSPGAIHGSLAELSAELDAVIERLREVSHDLYPSILVDRGLAAALRSTLGRLPLSARLVCVPDPLPRVPAEIESGAYFLVSEALANVLKHADATEITVRLEVTDDWLVVEIGDDGRGFAADSQVRNGGLLHMDDRTRSFGGHLTIDSAPGLGTRVRASFPVRAAMEVGGPPMP